MNRHSGLKGLNIAILGRGALADLLAARLQQHGARLALHTDFSAELPDGFSDRKSAGIDCAICLPDSVALTGDTVQPRFETLLRAGIPVLSTVPVEMLDKTALLAAAGAGKSCYHGTGGFQSRLATRFNRAFAAITRQIQKVELVEEIDFGNAPYPWSALKDTGLDDESADDIGAHIDAVSGFYEAGLNTLADAVFPAHAPTESLLLDAEHRDADDGPSRLDKTQNPRQLTVRRSAGETLAYDSIWRQTESSAAPLRYRLNTKSRDALGYVTLDFHCESHMHPADHLSCTGLLHALPVVCASAPGILRNDLDIWQVKADDRFHNPFQARH